MKTIQSVAFTAIPFEDDGNIVIPFKVTFADGSAHEGKYPGDFYTPGYILCFEESKTAREKVTEWLNGYFEMLEEELADEEGW